MLVSMNKENNNSCSFSKEDYTAEDHQHTSNSSRTELMVESMFDFTTSEKEKNKRKRGSETDIICSGRLTGPSRTGRTAISTTRPIEEQRKMVLLLQEQGPAAAVLGSKRTGGGREQVLGGENEFEQSDEDASVAARMAVAQHQQHRQEHQQQEQQITSQMLPGAGGATMNNAAATTRRDYLDSASSAAAMLGYPLGMIGRGDTALTSSFLEKSLLPPSSMLTNDVLLSTSQHDPSAALRTLRALQEQQELLLRSHHFSASLGHLQGFPSPFMTAEESISQYPHNDFQRTHHLRAAGGGGGNFHGIQDSNHPQLSPTPRLQARDASGRTGRDDFSSATSVPSASSLLVNNDDTGGPAVNNSALSPSRDAQQHQQQRSSLFQQYGLEERLGKKRSKQNSKHRSEEGGRPKKMFRGQQEHQEERRGSASSGEPQENEFDQLVATMPSAGAGASGRRSDPHAYTTEDRTLTLLRNQMIASQANNSRCTLSPSVHGRQQERLKRTNDTLLHGEMFSSQKSNPNDRNAGDDSSNGTSTQGKLTLVTTGGAEADDGDASSRPPSATSVSSSNVPDTASLHDRSLSLLPHHSSSRKIMQHANASLPPLPSASAQAPFNPASLSMFLPSGGHHMSQFSTGRSLYQQPNPTSSSRSFNKRKDSGIPELPLHFDDRPFVSLGTEEDPIWLSRFLCFLRTQCIEVFAAQEVDVEYRRSAKTKVEINQLGLRCRFCAHKPYQSRGKRSSCFPGTVSRIYQSVTMMIREHFKDCDAFPHEVRECYDTLKNETTKGELESKRYWAQSASKIGMKDTERGIFAGESASSELLLTRKPKSKQSKRKSSSSQGGKSFK